DRVERTIESDEGELAAARRSAGDASRPLGAGLLHGRDLQVSPSPLAARAAYLDAQALLPGAGRSRAGTVDRRRDYPGLASLAGVGRRQYERLAPPRQREVRAQIDRELAMRRELTEMHGDLISPSRAPASRRSGRVRGSGYVAPRGSTPASPQEGKKKTLAQ